jgi:hypothetical protein
MKSDEVSVYAATGEFDAQQMRAFFESHGIPSRLQGEALRKTHGLTLDGLGEVRILVGAKDEARARELLARVEAGELTLEDDVNPEGWSSGE